MTQEECLAMRIKQVLSEPGLHEIKVYISLDKTVTFWVVDSRKVEGEKSGIIAPQSDGVKTV